MSLRDALAAIRTVTVQIEAPNGKTAWERACSVLLTHGSAAGITPALDFATASPATIAAMSVGQLIEALRDVPRGPQKAGVLKALAQWWLNEFGDDGDPIWSSGLEHYRTELRRIRGLGPETVDRLLLFAIGLPVVPIDRGMLRVLVRHGWLDLPVDDESAQATLLSTCGPDVTGIQQTVARLQTVGHDFCGRVPECDQCPLKPYLPPSGPISPDAC